MSCTRDVHEYTIRDLNTVLTEIGKRKGLTVEEARLLNSALEASHFEVVLGKPPSVVGKSIGEVIEHQRKVESDTELQDRNYNYAAVQAELAPFAQTASATKGWLSDLQPPGISEQAQENLAFMSRLIGFEAAAVEEARQNWSKQPHLRYLYEAGVKLAELDNDLILMQTELAGHAFSENVQAAEHARKKLNGVDELMFQVISVRTGFDVAAQMALDAAERELRSCRAKDLR